MGISPPLLGEQMVGSGNQHNVVGQCSDDNHTDNTTNCHSDDNDQEEDKGCCSDDCNCNCCLHITLCKLPIKNQDQENISLTFTRLMYYKHTFKVDDFLSYNFKLKLLNPPKDLS